MDKIFLKGMKIETLIGVYEWERQQLQTLILDLDIGINNQAKQSDNIEDTLHYGVVCETLRQKLKEQKFLLLEALAEYIATLLFDLGAVWAKIRITKPGILSEVREVGVEIERHKGEKSNAN